MGLLRDLQAAIKEGLDDLLKTRSVDEVEEVTSLLENDVNETRTELSTARGDEQRLRGRIEQERADAQRFRTQAQAAVDRGDDSAARDYLKRERRSLRGVEILEQELVELKQLIELLSEHAEELDDKLQEVRLRRDFLRTRNKARLLKERYERYRRDFGLDPPPLAAEFELGRAAEQISRDDLLGEREPRIARRHVTDEEPVVEGTPDPVSGLGELPRPRRREEPSGLRSQPAGAGEPSDSDDRWDRPARDIRQLRDNLLHRIEADQRGAEFEATLDDELAKMRAGSAAVRPEVADDGELARRPEPPIDGPSAGQAPTDGENGLPVPHVELAPSDTEPEPSATGGAPNPDPQDP